MPPALNTSAGSDHLDRASSDGPRGGGEGDVGGGGGGNGGRGAYKKKGDSGASRGGAREKSTVEVDEFSCGCVVVYDSACVHV